MKVDSPTETDPGAPAETGHVRRTFFEGALAYGCGMGLQRILSFCASALAARLGGPTAFGSYALGLSTASLTATYTGLGIGQVSSRYAGTCPVGSEGRRRAVHLLIRFALGSAMVAALVLIAAAGPTAAHFAGRDLAKSVFRAAAWSAAALILVDAVSGIALGTLRYSACFQIQVGSGIGLVLVLPLVAHMGAAAMLLGQAAVVAAVAAWVASSLWREASRLTGVASGATFGSREILSFGLGQLSINMAASLAGWYLAVMVSRYDPTMVQMSQYAIGNQLRAFIAFAPTVASQMVMPLLSKFASKRSGHDDVVTATTGACTVAASSLGSLAMLGAPLILLVYGSGYKYSLHSAFILMATAVVHMSSAPMAQTLLRLSVRATVMINFAWSLVIVGFATLVVARGGGSLGASLGMLCAHMLSAALVALVLWRKGRLPAGILIRCWPMMGMCVLQAACACAPIRIVGPLFHWGLQCVFATGALTLAARETLSWGIPLSSAFRTARRMPSVLLNGSSAGGGS
jgi:O-antigen/teichoic acid export membrane protein